MDILITVLLIISIFIGLRYLTQKRAAKARGKEIDPSLFEDKIQDLLNSSKSILYFYTPTCSACKAQGPIIEKIDSETNAVGKIDLSINPGAAREFGIMGVPTTALMIGNKVADIFVGVKHEKFLRKRFDRL